MRCGSTGVVTFLKGRTLYVAWLGDSQVMMVKRGQPVELMKPHKPEREVRKSRHSAISYHFIFLYIYFNKKMSCCIILFYLK